MRTDEWRNKRKISAECLLFAAKYGKRLLKLTKTVELCAELAVIALILVSSGRNVCCLCVCSSPVQPVRLSEPVVSLQPPAAAVLLWLRDVSAAAQPAPLAWVSKRFSGILHHFLLTWDFCSWRTEQGRETLNFNQWTHCGGFWLFFRQFELLSGTRWNRPARRGRVCTNDKPTEADKHWACSVNELHVL